MLSCDTDGVLFCVQVRKQVVPVSGERLFCIIFCGDGVPPTSTAQQSNEQEDTASDTKWTRHKAEERS